MLFYFASVIAVWVNADFNSASPSPLYYVFASLLVVASFAVVCLYTRQFSYSDNKLCWILAFITVIAFAIFDVFVRDLYSFFPYNTLDVFIAIRRFFCPMYHGVVVCRQTQRILLWYARLFASYFYSCFAVLLSCKRVA